jgi:NADH-quinone oxidoreductase subunit N
VWGLAAASVVVGSILAIAQTNVKRMLAYSSIAHAGFILTGLTAPGAPGIRSAVFYLVAYAAMTVGAFGTVMLVSGRGESRTRLEDYAGLARTEPIAAALMSLFLLSLAGIPPTAGFIAKVSVFTAAIGEGYWALALIGVLVSVAAAFFYLRVIVLMYMREPAADAVPAAGHMAGAPVGAILAIPAAATLLLGVFPGIVVGIIEEASVLRW